MRARGFTLVELVVAITISGILIATVALIISRPVDAYNEQSRRNELLDTSSRIHRMIGNDLARALPNSVRLQSVGSTTVLQLLEVTDVLYYQDEPLTATPAQAATGLNFNTSDTRFQAYGSYTTNPVLVVANDATGAAYGNTGVITSVDVASAPQSFGAHTLDFAAPFQFTNGPSPTNRIFAIKAPITYVCNLASGQLTRFTDHARDPAIPLDESAPQLNSVGAQSSLLATGVTACALQCAAMIANRCQHTLTFSVTVSRGVAPKIDRVLVNRNYRVENTT